MIRFLCLQLSLSVLLLSYGGCTNGSGGNIGTVEGTVQQNGVPIENATVRFYPETGRGSSGTTDANGHYELRYTRNQDGAVIGEHKVTVSTEIEAGGDYGQDGDKARKETMPAKYLDRKTTVLTETVKQGNNTINFDLDAK